METPEQSFNDVVASVMSESSDTDIAAPNETFAVLNAVYDEPDTPATKLMKIRKYHLHAKTYSPKWEQDPNYRGWVQRSKKGDGFYYCLACNQDYTCGKSELDKHASSRKHCMNFTTMPKTDEEPYSVSYDVRAYDVQNITDIDSFDSSVLTQQDFVASSTSAKRQLTYVDSKEESFGKYIVSELKRIKRKKTYELVKWEILQALQKAMLKEAETEDSED